MEELTWGQTVTGTVERQSAHFFRLTITDKDLAKYVLVVICCFISICIRFLFSLFSGVIISCVSSNSDKFKLIFFDNLGQMSLVEESQTKNKHSEASFFAVPFTRYNLFNSLPLSVLKGIDEDLPPVFLMLDTFDKEIRNLVPGK